MVTGRRPPLNEILSLVAIADGIYTIEVSAPATVEPDTTQDLSLSISTPSGIPLAASLLAGTITITRVRAGVETVIINALACTAANGRISYAYTFPNASWTAGDEYKAVFTGQSVTGHALSDIRCKGRVTREGVIATAVLATAAGNLQIKKSTQDLQRAANTYDIWIGAVQDVAVEKLLIRLPNVNVSDDVNITKISIQTDDATPYVFITDVQGAKINLTAENTLYWTGFQELKVGKKIRLTIAGGAADAPTVCDVVVEYRAVVAGGLLS